MSRNYEHVSITLGYTALINLRRFFERGISCATDHCERTMNTSNEMTYAIRKELNRAMNEMRLLKAKHRLIQTGEHHE